jgi:hypothetical protein
VRLTRRVVPCVFDAELIRRYDRPGPRYTAYPTAPRFSPSFGLALAHHPFGGLAGAG